MLREAVAEKTKERPAATKSLTSPVGDSTAICGSVFSKPKDLSVSCVAHGLSMPECLLCKN